jgi:choline dehydrogenase-like flavoprotein
MQQTFKEIIETCGGRVWGSPPKINGKDAIHPGGDIIHEVGGALMGDDRRKSVTDQWCRTWDVPNLYLTDGAPFVSNADKNPTLTLMALAWRASDHLIGELKRGNL